MKEIITRKGERIIVCDCHYDRVAGYQWHISNRGYVVRSEYIGLVDDKSKSKKISLHQLIIGKKKGRLVDHINRDKLDNRCDNLRHVTPQENVYNRKYKTTSKYKGVTKSGRVKNPWTVAVYFNKSRKFIGNFETPEKAAKEYNKAVKDYHGKHAYINPL